MQDNVLNIIYKNILNDIKQIIDIGKINLNKDKQELIDNKMLIIIKDTFDEKYEEYFKEDNKDILYKKIIFSLAQYYVALYFDNLEVLHSLLNKELIFTNNIIDSNLFVLDKRLSSQFDSIDEYLFYFNKYNLYFEKFYISLYKNINRINDIEMIKRFCDLLKELNKQNVKEDYQNCLVVEIMLKLSNEEILKLTSKQLLNMSYIDPYINDKIELIRKYNLDIYFSNFEDFRELFSVEELIHLSQDDEELYSNIIQTSNFYDYDETTIKAAVNKLKEVKRINPEFNYVFDCMVYNFLSVEQLLLLLPETAETIESICRSISYYYMFKEDFTPSLQYYKFVLANLCLKNNLKQLIKGNTKKLTKNVKQR